MTQAAVMRKQRPALRSLVAVVSRHLDDRMNPIVVKELRQAVQSRFVLIVLILFLVIELFTIGIFLLASDDIGSDFSAGRNVFMVLQGVLLATCLLFVPLYAGTRLGAERVPGNVDLLFITTIRPSSIIWGKFLAGVVVTILIYSACAPFMVLTYLLRGIDVPTIGLILGLNLLVIIAAIQLALLIAAVPVSLVLKIVLALIGFILACWGYGATMVGATSMIYYGIGSSMWSWDFWGPVVAIVAMSAAVVGLMFFFSVAMISPPSSNRALPLRLYLMITWLVTGGIFWALSAGLHQPEFLAAWSGACVVVFSVLLFAVVSERDTWGPRLLRNVPRRWWLRWPAFLLFSGSAGGVIWCMAMISLSLLIFYYAIRWSTPSHVVEATQVMSILALYALCYSLTSVLIIRYLLRGKVKAVATFAVALFLMTFGSIMPPLVMFFINPRNWDRGAQNWLIANPIGVLVEDSPVFRGKCFTFTLVWTCIVLLLSVPWTFKQVRAFKPLKSVGRSDETA